MLSQRKRIRIEVEVPRRYGTIVATERLSFADGVWAVNDAIKAAKGILKDEYGSSKFLFDFGVTIEQETALYSKFLVDFGVITDQGETAL